MFNLVQLDLKYNHQMESIVARQSYGVSSISMVNIYVGLKLHSRRLKVAVGCTSHVNTES